MSRRLRATARHLCVAIALGVIPAAGEDSIVARATEDSVIDRACRKEANEKFKPFCDYHAAIDEMKVSPFDEDFGLVLSNLEFLAREASREEQLDARILLANLYYWLQRPLASWLEYARALSLQREMDGTHPTGRARSLEALKSSIGRGTREVVLEVPSALLGAPLTLDGLTATLAEWHEITGSNPDALQLRLPLTPGPHTAQWQQDHRACLMTLQIAPPSAQKRSPQLMPLQCPLRAEPASLAPLAWSLGGAAVAALLAGGIWLDRRKEAAAAFDRYSDNRSPANSAVASDARESRNIWAGIFTGATGVVVGLGAWYLVELVRRPASADDLATTSSAAASPRELDWRIGIAPSAGSVHLLMAF